MKIIISESQHKRLFEEEQKVLRIPSVKVFDDWNGLQRFLKSKGNPFYSIGGNLYLQYYVIESFERLISVGGGLDLLNSTITSLGNLTSVGGYLDLQNTNIESFENLTSVGGLIDLNNTPISKKYSEEEIRQMVNVRGDIYL